jgi:hypothetical protein
MFYLLNRHGFNYKINIFIKFQIILNLSIIKKFYIKLFYSDNEISDKAK